MKIHKKVKELEYEHDKHNPTKSELEKYKLRYESPRIKKWGLSQAFFKQFILDKRHRDRLIYRIRCIIQQWK